MKITGAKAWAFFDSFDQSKIISGSMSIISTEAGTWYRIIEKGENSNLPFFEGFPFRAPSGSVQIALVPGDRIYPLEPRRFCKTTASVQAEQGTVDVGDDCDPGATILDGIINITGSLAGLFNYDDQTSDFSDVTDDIVNRFFDVIEDDGNGSYELSPRNDEPVYLLFCLNSNAKVGQIENWLFVPIVISSMSVSLGNTDAQNKDLSWSKGQGAAVVYKRPKTE